MSRKKQKGGERMNIIMQCFLLERLLMMWWGQTKHLSVHYESKATPILSLLSFFILAFGTDHCHDEIKTHTK